MIPIKYLAHRMCKHNYGYYNTIVGEIMRQAHLETNTGTGLVGRETEGKAAFLGPASTDQACEVCGDQTEP